MLLPSNQTPLPGARMLRFCIHNRLLLHHRWQCIPQPVEHAAEVVQRFGRHDEMAFANQLAMFGEFVFH